MTVRSDCQDLNAIPRTCRIKCSSWRNAELKVAVDISLRGIGTHRASRRGGLTYTGYNIRLHGIDAGDDSRIKYQMRVVHAERIPIQFTIARTAAALFVCHLKLNVCTLSFVSVCI